MLERCRILVVEDEYALAQELRRELERVGAVVLGPEPSVSRALARVDGECCIDAAVLDVNLDGEPVFPVAAALAARKAPFMFTTGYQDVVVKTRYPEAPICDKPIDTQCLLDALQELLHAPS